MVAPDYRQRYANATEALDAIESLIPSPIPPRSIPVPKPVPPSVLTIPVVPSSSEATVQTPVNQGVNRSSTGIDRRNFLKWLGFGGVGVVSVLALSQIIKNSSIFTEALGNGVELRMVKIPGGTFLMGSPESEKERKNNESSQHKVNISEFYLGQTLVTQAQWVAIMEHNPSNFQGNDKLPVETVSWLDAMDFCDKLSQKTGRTYRLPSEAEWEYACRAGTTTPFAFGETITPAVVNYNGDYPYGGEAKGEYRQKTTPVGIFPPNQFGLYDLHGNLREWCLDEWVNSYDGAPTDGSVRGNISFHEADKQRLLRGGSWYDNASDCRSAKRFYLAASYSSRNFGFRVMCLPSRTS